MGWAQPLSIRCGYQASQYGKGLMKNNGFLNCSSERKCNKGAEISYRIFSQIWGTRDFLGDLSH